MTIDHGNFLNLFAGTPDQVLLESQYGPVPLTAPNDVHAHAEAHLLGQDRLGVFSMGDDATVRWATLPFDRHCLPDAWAAAQTVHAALQRYGIPSYLEALEPTPDPEYRLWLFFDTPRNAKHVAHLLRGLVVDCELDDTLPIVPGGAEALADTPQRVWLPLYGGDNAAGFVDANGQLYPDQGQVLAQIQTVPSSTFAALEHDLLPVPAGGAGSPGQSPGNEHGFQQVIKQCPFVAWCREHAAEGLPKPLFTALATNLIRFGAPGTQAAAGDRPAASSPACQPERFAEAPGPPLGDRPCP